MMGVSDPHTGCVCAGADANAADGTDTSRGYYANKTKANNNNAAWDCKVCPKGGDCEADGLVLSELSAKTGSWRANNNTEIFADCADAYMGLDSQALADARCCPVMTKGNVSVSKCKQANGHVNETSFTSWNSDDQCLKGYIGPLCRACDLDNGYVAIGEGCTPCPGGARIGSAVGFLVGIMVFLFLGVLVVLLMVKFKVF
jgi:hypothetical protein